MIRDIVCFVRESDSNEELRYAIRSWVKNLPHRNVVIVGHLPSFLNEKAVHIPVKQGKDKYLNTTDLMVQACLSDAVSDKFYLANDDFFVMRPVIKVPLYYWGSMEDVINKKIYETGVYDERYFRSMDAMPKRSLCFSLHIPMPVSKDEWIRCYRYYGDDPFFHENKRTFYGNFSKQVKERKEDVKIYDMGAHGFEEYDYLSTAPDTFEIGEVGEFIRSKFTEKSPYEK